MLVGWEPDGLTHIGVKASSNTAAKAGIGRKPSPPK